MKYLILLACISCALTKPAANEKRIFGWFNDETTAHPALEKLKNIGDQLEEMGKHIDAHHHNVTNRTNAGLERIAHFLEKVEGKAVAEIEEVLEVMEELKSNLTNGLGQSIEYLENGKDYFKDMHKDFDEHVADHFQDVKDKVQEVGDNV